MCRIRLAPARETEHPGLHELILDEHYVVLNRVAANVYLIAGEVRVRIAYC
jgi:hypothetical protein